MKNFNFALLVLITLLTCSNTNSSSSKQESSFAKLEPVNIVVLLDLSDRIVITDGQATKDLGIIKSILDKFEERQKQQVYIKSSDHLSVLVAPQPGVNVSSNDDLVIDMKALNRPKNGHAIGRPAFVEARNKFNSALKKLYDKAAKSPHTGADIYTFFCSDYAMNNMKVDANINNKLIVITDGYLVFSPGFGVQRPKCSYMRNLAQLRTAKENWKNYFQKNNLAMCPCTRKFKNTEVMLLETAPLNKGTSVYEFDIVQHYWKNWFDAMTVNVQIFPHDSQVTNISSKIKIFLD